MNVFSFLGTCNTFGYIVSFKGVMMSLFLFLSFYVILQFQCAINKDGIPLYLSLVYNFHY